MPLIVPVIIPKAVDPQAKQSCVNEGHALLIVAKLTQRAH
jgi:hypothetical protein